MSFFNPELPEEKPMWIVPQADQVALLRSKLEEARELLDSVLQVSTIEYDYEMLEKIRASSPAQPKKRERNMDNCNHGIHSSELCGSCIRDKQIASLTRQIEEKDKRIGELEEIIRQYEYKIGEACPT